MNPHTPTPGPWHYQEESDAYTHIVRGPKNVFICQLQQDTTGWAEANARLIAAAPDLLAALNELRDDETLPGRFLPQICDAIAKAGSKSVQSG